LPIDQDKKVGQNVLVHWIPKSKFKHSRGIQREVIYGEFSRTFLFLLDSIGGAYPNTIKLLSNYLQWEARIGGVGSPLEICTIAAKV
jgi:hypothetical protein